MKFKDFFKKYCTCFIVFFVIMFSIIGAYFIIHKDGNVDNVINIEEQNNIIDVSEEKITNTKEEINNQEVNDNTNNSNTIIDDDKDINDNNVNKDTTSSNNNSNNSSSNNNSNNNSNSNSNSNNDSNNDINSNNNDDKEEIVLSQEELNNQYREQLETSYGIKIAYGDEMGNYYVTSYLPTKMTDEDEINEYLGRLENQLKKYPIGFFKEMKDFGTPLTLYLVKEIPNSGIAGLTDSQFANNIIITIKSGLLFEHTLNHELMHYIDVYIRLKAYPEDLEPLWNSLNPDGYNYGSFDKSLDFITTQNNNSYFLSNYAQTNWREDRATLFEDMMTRAIKRNCYSEGTPLYNKIKLISEQIDKYFDCVNNTTTEYWERFL
ncbi:MAG: hypothetical protein ACI4XM_08200 [Candidatus Coprovivens sp.]